MLMRIKYKLFFDFRTSFFCFKQLILSKFKITYLFIDENNLEKKNESKIQMYIYIWYSIIGYI